LGQEAQHKAVEDLLDGGNSQLVKELVEVESGKKSDRQRPVLAEAIKTCRLYGAKLVIAKIDRPSAVAHFLLGEKADIDCVAADMPNAQPAHSRHPGHDRGGGASDDFSPHQEGTSAAKRGVKLGG
jgi:hypothetical protein